MESKLATGYRLHDRAWSKFQQRQIIAPQERKLDVKHDNQHRETNFVIKRKTLRLTGCNTISIQSEQMTFRKP